MIDWTQFETVVSDKDMANIDKLVKNKPSEGNYEPIPYGQYEVSIRKIELGTTKPDAKNPNVPKVSIWFKVINHPNLDGTIFCDIVVFGKNAMWGIARANRLLASMKTDVVLDTQNFVTNGKVNYSEYAKLLEAVYDDIKAKGYEYALNYSENDKGFKTYTITDVFEPTIE